MRISDTEVYGFERVEWFNNKRGIRLKDNRWEVNVTVGHQVTKYLGRYRTLAEALENRKEYYINLFLSNLKENDIDPFKIKETEFNNYFATKEGFIVNKFGNLMVGATNRCGYKMVIIANKFNLVHRVILKTLCPIEDMGNLDVNHKDGNKTNNNISNLEWCTRSENVIHSYKNGLQDNVGGHRLFTKDDKYKLKMLLEYGIKNKDSYKYFVHNPETIRGYIKKERGL